MKHETPGKPAQFICKWCEKKVNGHLTIITIDFLTNKIEKEFTHPECPWRTTRIKNDFFPQSITEGCK